MMSEVAVITGGGGNVTDYTHMMTTAIVLKTSRVADRRLALLVIGGGTSPVAIVAARFGPLPGP